MGLQLLEPDRSADQATEAGLDAALAALAERCGVCGRACCPVERHIAQVNRLDALDQRGLLTPELDLELWLSWKAERITSAFCAGTDRRLDLDLDSVAVRS